MELYRSICAANRVPLILDLGAHSGIASTYFTREFPEAKVIAVEPDADNLALARLNLSREKNVHFILGGVSSQPGKGRIVDSGLGSWGYRTEHHDQGSIEMRTVNSILEDVATSSCKPFIAKIDIEGFEEDLFTLNTEWVDKFPLVIIELHDWLYPRQNTSRSFLKCVAELDRDFVYINENVFSIKNRPTKID